MHLDGRSGREGTERREEEVGTGEGPVEEEELEAGVEDVEMLVLFYIKGNHLCRFNKKEKKIKNDKYVGPTY